MGVVEGEHVEMRGSGGGKLWGVNSGKAVGEVE